VINVVLKGENAKEPIVFTRPQLPDGTSSVTTESETFVSDNAEPILREIESPRKTRLRVKAWLRGLSSSTGVSAANGGSLLHLVLFIIGQHFFLGRGSGGDRSEADTAESTISPETQPPLSEDGDDIVESSQMFERDETLFFKDI
jgi:hypothetical protein